MTLSLAADALIVVAGTRVFHVPEDYTHFRFGDYATLTAIGVVAACAAWPVIIRISTSARRLFCRLAVVVTLVLWLPDAYLLLRQQPVQAVAVLMTMHLAIALVTYNLLVRVAPAPPGGAGSLAGEPPVAAAGSLPTDSDPVALASGLTSGRTTAHLAWLLEVLVGLELVLGIVALVEVPTGRSSGWLPDHGRSIYLLHAALGLPLAIGAIAYLSRVRGSSRIGVLSGWIGLVGVVVAGLGGLLTVSQPVRLVGIGLMLVGGVAAAFGYLLPALDRMTDDEVGGGG